MAAYKFGRNKGRILNYSNLSNGKLVYWVRLLGNLPGESSINEAICVHFPTCSCGC